MFDYAPGRIFEVWTAPLRVTTLTLGPEETVVAKAAGDTVRWQIGETSSGPEADRRTHVMIKPLRQGLETNLVLTTNQRLYLLQLRSGAPAYFNAAIAWKSGEVIAPPVSRQDAPLASASAPAATPPRPTALASETPMLDARFRISPVGRRPVWTPRAVMTDGLRTYLVFPPALAASEAPVLLAVGPGGDSQVVNYRQRDRLWVVDRVLLAAELRLGTRRPQVVRIQRLED